MTEQTDQDKPHGSSETDFDYAESIQVPTQRSSRDQPRTFNRKMINYSSAKVGAEFTSLLTCFLGKKSICTRREGE